MYRGFAKFIRGTAFRMMFLILAFALVCYTSLRLGSILEYYFAVKAYGVLFFILFFLFLYMILYQNSKKEIKKTRSLYERCSMSLCFMLNLVLCLLAEDLIGIFLPFFNDGMYVFAVMASVILTLYGIFHANQLYVNRYEIHLHKTINPVRIALLSDIHTGSYVNCRQLKKIVDYTNRLNCDYILIAGDTFDVEAFEYCNLPEIADELQKLKAVKGVYAILGNHDPASTDVRIIQFFQRSKIHLLVDEITETEDFILIGRDDINTNPQRKALKEILRKADSEKPRILLDHNPVGIGEGIENNVDLVLSGHTHKGQFFPATLFTKWSYGKQGFYGYSKTNGTHSVVSSGTGYFQIPMRIGTNSEIVQIELDDKNGGSFTPLRERKEKKNV